MGPDKLWISCWLTTYLDELPTYILFQSEWTKLLLVACQDKKIQLSADLLFQQVLKQYFQQVDKWNLRYLKIQFLCSDYLILLAAKMNRAQIYAPTFT